MLLRRIGDIIFFGVVETLYPEEQEFFLNVYEQFKRIMYKTALKYVSDITVAEDLVQDAIVKLIPKTPTMQKLNQKALLAYVVTTVRNVSIDHLKRQMRTAYDHGYSELDEELHNEFQLKTQTPEEILLNEERSEELRKRWDNLNNKDKDILLGKYILGLTDKELARQYGCKPNSIRMILTRARRNALNVMQNEVHNDDETR